MPAGGPLRPITTRSYQHRYWWNYPAIPGKAPFSHTSINPDENARLFLEMVKRASQNVSEGMNNFGERTENKYLYPYIPNKQYTPHRTASQGVSFTSIGVLF